MPSADAWAGITMPTSGICRDPSGRGSWCTTTTSSTSITAVRTARPVRRARSSAHGADPRPQLERVEVDVAHGQHRRAEPVLAGVVLLHHDPVHQQGLHDPVHGRRRQVQPLRDLAQAQPVVALEHGEDPQRAVHGLDHLVSRSDGADRCKEGLVHFETEA